MIDRDTKTLESFVEWHLMVKLNADTVEIPDLSEDEYNQLRKTLDRNYLVKGAVKIPRNGNRNTTYKLIITRKK